MSNYSASDYKNPFPIEKLTIRHEKRQDCFNIASPPLRFL